MVFKLKRALKITPYIDKGCLFDTSSDAIERLMSTRKNELLPAGLHPYSSLEQISNRAKQIRDDITDLIKVNGHKLEDLWSDLCELLGKRVGKIPMLSQVYKTIKKMLIKATKQATFIYQSTLKNSEIYADYDFTKWLKQFKKETAYFSFYENELYTQSEYRKQYHRASSYLARSTGQASLAMKDGLTGYFLTVTLKSVFHQNSEKWEGRTPDEGAKLISKANSDWYQWCRNNNVNLEAIRAIEPDKNGTPHLHGLIFTDTPEKALEGIKKIFIIKHGLSIEKGIYLQKAKNIKRSIRYLLKTFWGPYKYRDGNDDELIAWTKNIGVRRFGISSLMRKYPTVELWDECRKGRADIEKYTTLLAPTYHELSDGDSYITLAGEYHYNLEDAVSSVNSSLNESAETGDYAQFTRLFSAATKTRKKAAVQRLSGILTISTLDETELRTISQDSTNVTNKVVGNIRDIEDFKWLLYKKAKLITPPTRKKMEFMNQFREIHSYHLNGSTA